MSTDVDLKRQRLRCTEENCFYRWQPRLRGYKGRLYGEMYTRIAFSDRIVYCTFRNESSKQNLNSIQKNVYKFTVRLCISEKFIVSSIFFLVSGLQ